MQAEEHYACALRLEPRNNAWEEEAKLLGFIKRHVNEGWCISVAHTNVSFEGHVCAYVVFLMHLQMIFYDVHCSAVACINFLSFATMQCCSGYTEKPLHRWLWRLLQGQLVEQSA